MAHRGGVVVVTGRDPDRIDRMASQLRDAHTVRVTYPSTDLDARIDASTDVVVVLDGAVVSRPPALSGGLPQIGLVGTPADLEGPIDAVLTSPVEADDIREMVDSLTTRAQFLRTLESSYQLARQVSDHEDPCREAIERYREELATMASALSGAEPFELLARSIEPVE
ncbi:MAG: hypothetical protein ABEJ86_02655 [Halococcoides sp.]